MSDIYGGNGDTVYQKNYAVQSNGDGQDTAQVNLLLLFDATGSTSDKLDGGPKKIDEERKFAFKWLEKLSNSPIANHVNIAVRTIGYTEGTVSDCQETSLIIPMGPLCENLPLIEKKLTHISPQGKTPLTYALQQSFIDLSGLDGRLLPGSNQVFVLTDGLNSKDCSCGVTPEMVAQRMAEQKVSVDFVGFGLKPSEKQEVADIARAGNGRFTHIETDAQMLTPEELAAQADKMPCHRSDAFSTHSAYSMGKRHQAWGKVMGRGFKNVYTPGLPQDIAPLADLTGSDSANNVTPPGDAFKGR